MTVTYAPAVSAALYDRHPLRLAVNRIERTALKRWPTPGCASMVDTLRGSLRSLSRYLSDADAMARAVACPVYGSTVVDLTADVLERLGNVENVHGASGLHGLNRCVERLYVAIVAASTDHGPTLAPPDAPLAVRLPLMAARVAWLDDRVNDAIDSAETGLETWFANERDGLMAEIARLGSDHLRNAGLRSDGQRTAANRIPGLDY